MYLIIVLLFLGGSSGSSLQYFFTSVSKPGQGLPEFTAVGYVDGQLFVQYDSNTKKVLPRASWMSAVEKDDPEYLVEQTHVSQANEQWFRTNINILRNRYNQSGGVHILQLMCGCELKEDGSKGGYRQYAYDGRDFIAFDKETLTWTAADAQAQQSKRKLDALREYNKHVKSYLEENCVEGLQKYLHYGKNILLRKEPPKMKVTNRADHDDMETLICRADGFYPKDIEVVWRRDGEVWDQETLRGFVTPNSDGTYHTWISIKIDPKDKGRFLCRVDHATLDRPLDFAVEDPAPASNLWPIVGSIPLGLLLVAVITGIWCFRKKPREEYRAAPVELTPST